MDKNKEEYLILLFAFVVLAVTYFFVDPSILGFIVYENQTVEQIDTFNYNSSLIEFGEDIRLKATIENFTWVESNISFYAVNAGYYNPDDKVNKVKEVDGYLAIDEDEIFNIAFDQELENNDILTLLIKSGSPTNIYLCGATTECGSSEYGSIYYNGTDDQWLNISLINLNSPKNIFGLDIEEDIKVYYISSTRTNLSHAYINYNDELNKIQQIGEGYLAINKDKIFDIGFDNALKNGDIINLYLKNSDASPIHLCNPSISCEPPGYGLVDFDGNEGWVNIVLSELSSPMKMFYLDPVSIKIDYINASHTEETTLANQTVAYNPAYLETFDFEPENLSHWNNLAWDHTLNDQNIVYMYSTDGGSIWINLTSNSLLGINSSKIRFKILLETNGTETPILYSLILNYTALFDVDEIVGGNETSEGNETSLPVETPPSSAAPSGGGGSGGSSQTTFAEEGEATLVETDETEEEEKSLELVNPILSSEKENKPIDGAAVKETEEGGDAGVFGYFILVFVILILFLIYFFCFKRRRSKRSTKKK
ncbi:MAG: hypothetical protein ABIB47_03735 [Candidatus Woesearchaeota archaeon]